MIKRSLTIACVAVSFTLLVGCSGASNSIVDINKDTKGYKITCDGGIGSSKSDCYKQAAYICQNKGYSVMSEKNIAPNGWMGDDYEIMATCNN